MSENYVYPNGTGVLCVGTGRLHLDKEQVIALAVAGVVFVNIETGEPLPAGDNPVQVSKALASIFTSRRERRPNRKPKEATRVAIVRITTPDSQELVEANLIAWIRRTFEEEEVSRAYFAFLRHGKYQGYFVQKIASRNITSQKGNIRGSQ